MKLRYYFALFGYYCGFGFVFLSIAVNWDIPHISDIDTVGNWQHLEFLHLGINVVFAVSFSLVVIYFWEVHERRKKGGEVQV